MQAEGKIQKWGNSSAIRLSAKVLAAAGITNDSDVDIQADSGRLVIQLKERTQEQLFDKLLAEESGSAEVLKHVRDSLSKAIAETDETTSNVYALLEKLEQREKS
jgi:antitoxin component of MazEF toxin-antitoxin module